MKQKIFNLIRKYVLIYLTGNLGIIKETDDKIICYVKKNVGKLDISGKTIACFGIASENQELANVYHINKPVCYVFEGIEFNKQHMYIFGYNNCEVIVKDCKFKYGLTIHVNGTCILDNNCIIPLHNGINISADNLIIKNINIDNKFKPAILGKQNIMIGATKDLDIIETNIGAINENLNISIFSSDKMNVINSKIAGNVVKCGAIDFQINENSEIIASSMIDIKAKQFDKINIKSPKIFYNEQEIISEKEKITLRKIKSPLELKIKELIDTLKIIKEECERTNSEDIKTYKSSLNNKSISRVLKK